MAMQMRGSFWSDRRQAGQELAQRLAGWHGQAQRAVVIGLPRGGVEVAAEVARALGLPLALGGAQTRPPCQSGASAGRHRPWGSGALG